MAVNQGLNVQLSADASQFISTLQAALAQAQAAASGMVDTASSMNAMASAANTASAAAAALNASLNAVTQSANNTSQSANAAANSAQNLGNSTLQASRGFGVFQNAITNGRSAQTILVTQARAGLLSFNGLSGSVTNAGRAIQNIRRPVFAGGAALTDFSRIAQDLPFGFIAIQNNIPPLIESLGRLSASSGGAMGALRALSSAMMGPAGIAFAVSAVTSLVTVSIQKYGSLGNAFNALFKSADAAAEAQKRLTDALGNGIDNAQTELVHLRTLYDATQNVNIPLAQRNKIVDELQKKYPAYFGNLNNEAILAGNASQAYNKLKDSIIAVAQSKAIEEELVNQAKAGRKLRQEYSDLLKTREKLTAEQQKTSQGGGLFNLGVSNTVAAAAGEIEVLNEKLAANLKKQQDVEKESDSLAAENQKLAESFNEVTTGFDKQTKSGKSSQDVLKLLTSELAAIDYQAQLTGASFDSISKDKVAALQKAFDSLVKLGLTPASPVLKNIADQINLIGSATIGTESIGKRLQEVGKAFVAPKIDFGGIQNVAVYQKQLTDSIGVLVAAANQKLNDSRIVWGNLTTGLGNVVIDIGNQLQALTVATSVGIGEMIGNVLSGTDSFGSALYKLVGIMGQFVVDFGKSLIEAATLKIIATKSLVGGNPYVALAAGIAAVAVGSALKSKTPSFATGGGIVGGPQLAMIGDNPGREEYVIPSEVLDKLGGGGARIVRVVGVLRGQDIAFANQRANRAKARIN